MPKITIDKKATFVGFVFEFSLKIKMIDYSSSLPKVIQCTFWMLHTIILAYILNSFKSK